MGNYGVEKYFFFAELERSANWGKFFTGVIYVLALSSASIVNISAASADATVTPSAFCTRPGFGGNGSWTCTVPTVSGGQAVIGGVPSDSSGSSIDLAVLNAWISSNLGKDAVILGDMSTSASGKRQ